MKFMNACNVAMQYFSKQYGDIALSHIRDIGDSWVFSGTDGTGRMCYGKQALRIEKQSGKQRLFLLSDSSSWRVWDKGYDIPVPKEYMINS